MTVLKNLCVRLLLKINASRYPSRNLRVTFASADFLTKSGIVHFPGLWKQLETWHCGRQARHWLTLAAALQTLELRPIKFSYDI